ncbi:MAG TPA: hypothetical protein VNB90_16455 [Cytophagaceae bacterium]|nr:hypothetical protein [Cytophagaceae bacterium]
MVPNLKAEERELIRLVNFFKKKVKMLVAENKATEDYTELVQTCEKLVEQIAIHAQSRDAVLEDRERLKGLIKEQALCPRCEKNTNLKLIGTDKSPEGWKSNKYRCKKCNIEFVWNMPNNPWDMVPYVEKYIAELEIKLQQEEVPEEVKKSNILAIDQLKGNLAKLKPVVEASDLDLSEMESRDKEMGEIVKNFTKHLMIEKIRMEE